MVGAGSRAPLMVSGRRSPTERSATPAPTGDPTVVSWVRYRSLSSADSRTRCRIKPGYPGRSSQRLVDRREMRREAPLLAPESVGHGITPSARAMLMRPLP